jgi:hypothetical protein
MRVMTIGLDRQHVRIHAIVHDGWLLSCKRGEENKLRAAIEYAKIFANEKVLDGFPLKIDPDFFTDRFVDKDGQEVFDFIMNQLPKERLYVPNEDF